jgi:ubiquinone/menaquinone biosynthesis C-methylase UbiE
MFPYFDVLFEKLKKNDTVTQDAFGEHVHWGYWSNPGTQKITPKDYNHAGELMVQEIIKQASLKDNITVLDAGCGLGGTIRFLNEKLHNCTLIGINIDERQLDRARKLTISKNGNTIEFLYADACSLPFSEKKFDVVLCIESIFHFDDRKAFFHECQRVLRPGGIVVFSDFVPIKMVSSFLNFMERAFDLVKNAYGIVHIDISIQKYKQIAKECGFSLNLINDITNNTLPTYTFLKNNFHMISEAKKFSQSTRFIEYATKLGILKYLIISFRKIKQ